MSDWISVKDRLPDENTEQFRYLVVYGSISLRKYGPKKPIVDIAGYGSRRNDNCKDDPRGWRWETHFYELGMLAPCNCWIDNVTHWMPLPEPPDVS